MQYGKTLDIALYNVRIEDITVARAVLSKVFNFCGGLATIDAVEDWSELLVSNTREVI